MANFYDGASNYNDETLNREALLAQMKPTAAQPTKLTEAAPATAKPYEVGGITGGEPGGIAGTPAPTGATPEKVDYTQLGQYKDRMGAWNGNEKFNRGWDDKSERYKMLTVMSHFDPNQGISPELLDALNGANIHGAKFSGSRDKLNVENAGGWDRFGSGGIGDVIQGFNDPNNKTKNWSPWSDPNLDTPAPAAGGGQNFLSGPSSFSNAVLAGNNNVPTDEGTYNLLQQQLQGILGPAATDRNALLALMRQ
jgi:hypothetical protein